LLAGAQQDDPKDDHLIAYAVTGQADYLVSGDKELLLLQTAGSVAIVNSAQFRQVLSKQDS
jgi:predicted nucleic acid-binding protein